MPLRRLIGLIAIIGAAFLAGAMLLPHSPAELRELLLAAGVAAPLIALASWALLTPAMFSGALLAAASGLAFGAVGGAAVSVAGAVLGGLAAFALARAIGREHVEAMLQRHAKLKRVHALLEERGFLAILAARLMPGVPTTGLHYAAGVSPVGTSAFAAAIAIGALLLTTPYAVLGQGIGSGSPATIVAGGTSIALGALAAAILVRRLRAQVAVS